MISIRNVAIIAHVDHGKTTLVDALLRQSKTKLRKDIADTELIMDSNELERERGITIFSKNASVQWGDTKINIIDTPGHADFGGEVERVLKMADGCLLLIDAKEGPMPQTRFVLRKALEMGLRIILIINKMDKPDARPDFVLNASFDLFVELGADDKTLNFPYLYASAKQGKAGHAPDIEKMTDISPVFETILKEIPLPQGNEEALLQMLITTISADAFKGRIATGRVFNGILRSGQEITHISRNGEMKKYRITSLMTYEGLERIDAKEVRAGDIAAISGIPEITIGETIADPNNPQALALLKMEEPTVMMAFSINNSPFAGKEGQMSTSRQIRERLYKELESDMALRVQDNPNGHWMVSGRGELHLSILIERMRREGYEFQVSRPQAIIKEIKGVKMTPYEKVYVEIPQIYSGAVIQKLGKRNGELEKIHSDNNTTFLEFIIPTRGLFGYRNEFLTDTKGLGIINTLFLEYRPDPGNWREREQGSLVAHETGTTNLYGLLNAQGRGQLFLGPGISIYKGQVVGQNSRQGDIAVNICKSKQLSNMRSKGEGGAEHFNAPKTMGLEDALEYIGEDELVEITPKNIRIRKKILDAIEERRKKLGIQI